MPRKPILGTCELCGKQATLTVDHLPPKCIYTKIERSQIPGQMNTVKACRNCNGEGSPSDENLKLLIGIATSDDRYKDGLAFTDHIGGTLAGNRKLGREFLQGSSREGTRIRVDMEGDPFRKAIKRILHGLYYQKFGKVIDQSASHLVYGLSQELAFMRFLENEEHTSLNGGTFKYAVNYIEENQLLWRLVFFGQAAVYALTHLPSEGATENG